MSDEYGVLIDHVHLRVSDLPASRKFYEAAVSALGLAITWENDHAVEIRELFLVMMSPRAGRSISPFAPEHARLSSSSTRRL